MEDAITIKRNYGKQQDQAFFAVYDGHYGSKAAQYLSEKLHKSIEKIMAMPEIDPHKAITDSFSLIDKEFLKEASQKLWNDGSTAVVAIILQDKIYIANTGDSRAVLSARSQIIATQDHKPNDPKEKKKDRREWWVCRHG